MSTDIAGAKILITGGHGFLGRRLVERFKRAGGQVFAPSRSEYDLTDHAAADALFRTLGPELVIHAAGLLGGIKFSRLFPADVFLRNLQIACNVLELAARHEVRKLVNIGSACVYSDELEGPFKETDVLALPMHPSVRYYGFSKQALYIGAHAFREQYKLNSIHLIPTNLYGPGDKFDPELSHVISSFVPKFFHAARTGQSVVTCWGTGNTVREFMHVDDCAEAVLLATQRYADTEPMNLGSGQGITIRSLAEHVKRLTAFNGTIAWDSSKPDGAAYKVLDTSKMRSVLGWSPRISLEEGLRNTVESFAQNYEIWERKHVLDRVTG